MKNIKNYIDIKRKYKLNKNISEEQLKSNGFKGNVYRCWIYKDVIQLIVCLDLNDKTWDYQVYDVDNSTLYVAYYNREFGANDVVKTIDKNINNILKEFEKENIFVKNGE